MLFYFPFFFLSENLRFKDEAKGAPIESFAGLRAKMYAIKLGGQDFMKKCKGVKKYILKNQITFQHFYECLTDNCSITVEQNSIRSKGHQPFSITERKLALDGNDNKRYVLSGSDGYSLPWGHYSI